ncbi:hypothetical protein PUNSTDRAFT_60596 [Punctularia strigosozonata HHB-11173 SS5]|uniref:uncharacterized protein n=1 Tax=Punctularia strigosozonata (strain HHB-11173) TaxID=741275 RepID=UPI0004416AAC|nr:uncharacterized protein PUNSTDRAFT_60596 [Punctularia strigosozonata HHB-11173 SS5]EIN12869.1 hypothetical protein PUNSTDRAFT_60596 [Punctularia strigosozonata HHB-11173 SS5]
MAPHEPINPTPSRDATSGGPANIVSNFQDLSAVLSILASDTVEQKYTSSRAMYWERMSGVWSLFGILGVLRPCLMLLVGVARAESAGVHIYGTGAYTAQKTEGASSTVIVGESVSDHLVRPENWWQDDQRRLLGLVHESVPKSTWIRPHVIVVGYSKCPFVGSRAAREVAGIISCLALSVVCTVGPLAALRPPGQTPTTWTVTVALAALAATLASLLPVLLQRHNSVGVAPLHILHATNRFSHGAEQAAIHDLDTVSTTGTSNIRWQSASCRPWLRSGDTWTIRATALLTTAAIVAFYILNYLVLGSSTTQQSYTWLGIQVFLLAARYVLWSYRGRIVSRHLPSVLFLVAGSLVDPLPLAGINQYEPSPMPSPSSVQSLSFPSPSPRLLSRDVVHFATASARSKIFNVGASTTRLRLSALDKLSAVAPADLIAAPYCEMRDCIQRVRSPGSLRAIRLPWSFVEEVYAAQGLVLGSNPWALGGLYLAAVVSEDRFWGLTTVHPRAHADGAHGEDSYKSQTARPPQAEPSRSASGSAEEGVTRCGCVIDSLEDGGTTGDFAEVDEVFERWHRKFWDKVSRCRRSARENGPTHCEVHVYQMGSGDANIGRKHMTRTEETLAEGLQVVHDIVQREGRKDHSRCSRHCTIHGF